MSTLKPKTSNCRLLLLFFFVWVALPCRSVHGQISKQNIKFNNISIKNGLSQSSPNCIFQDSRGIMWIGTEDGLNKYDGYSFTVYKPLQDDKFSISNPRIISISEDYSGNLWIGTNGGGLNKYSRKYNKFYGVAPESNEKNIVAGNIVYSQLQVKGNKLWLGTNKGLVIVNTVTSKYADPTTNFACLTELSGLQINALTSDNDNLWIGTSNGLFCLDTLKKSIVRYLNNPSDKQTLQNNRVTYLLIDKFHNLIIGTETGVSVMDLNQKTFADIQLSSHNGSGNRYNYIKAILEDNEGNLWIATLGNGLYIGSVQSGIFTNFVYDHLNPYSLKNNEVLSLFKDFSGIIWVGSNGIDLYNPKKEKFVLYDYVPYSSEQLVFRNIHPIYEDAAGVLWIGSKTDGLHILNRSLKTYKRWVNDPSDANSLSSNRIRAIREFPDGILWVGTENEGLNKVYLDGERRPLRFKHFKNQPGNSNSITSNKIYALYPDDKGKLWIGTDNGLTVMDTRDETFKQYIPDSANTKSISNSTVYAIYGDTKGNIWLATDMGVNLYDPESDGFIHFIHKEKDDSTIIHNEILCFHEDAENNIWIGTYGKGLDKFDPVHRKFTHFSDIPELSTAVIYGILEDTQGNFWMSSNNGIIKFNPKSRELKEFNIEDGLQSNEFNGTSYFMNNTGEMFFGGQYGFNSFYPKEVKIDTIVPKIILSDLQVHNISVIPGEQSPIDSDISEAKEIVLNYKQNNFTLYFSALHFANSSLNRYKYKLEGFDKDWIDIGNKRFVSYTNLPYRSYKFRVLASNSDGVWNNKGLVVKIRVKPPLWATIWFRILAGICIAGCIYYFIRRRLTYDQRQKKIIQEKFDASSRELEEARTQLDKQHEEIVIQKRELLQREKDQENLIWFNQGLGLFSDLISKNRESLTHLCKIIIEKLVDYVEAQQGGIFLLNDGNESEHYLELTAHYAYSAGRTDQRIAAGEGYVGACFRDKKFIEVDNLTDNYSEFSSGLGKMYVKHLVLAPLMVNNDCIGVVELGSFRKIKGYRISFIEKLIENFASIISTELANNRLRVLIEQSTKQAKELAENEEQLRMNLEEIMATQEESTRREDELIKLAEESATREEMLNQEIEQLKSRIQ